MTTAKTDNVKVTGLENEVVVQVGPPLIQTAEDARQAFFRGQLTEDQLREALGKFGMAGGVYGPQTPAPAENFEIAFERKLPDDLQPTPPVEYLDFEDRLKLVDAKREKREAYTEAHDKVMKDAPVAEQYVDPNVKVAATVPDSKDKAIDKKITEAVASVYEDDKKK